MGLGGEFQFRVKVEISSPSSPSSPKNKINLLITNETENLKAAVFQAPSFPTKPVKPNGQNEETTGGAAVKQERNILSMRVEDQRFCHPEFLEAERQRMAKVAAAAKLVAGAAVPAQCGGRIIPAPGRGPFRVEPQAEMVPNGTDARGQDKWAEKEGGFAGWNPIRQADVFDLMEASARRRSEPAPFTPAQIAVARHYRALVERHDAGGIKCSALDGRTSGGTGRDFMDAYLSEGREIEAMRRRIGTGVALAVRRIRPSARGGAERRGIPDRALVDMVCLGDRSLSDVLKAHGWATFGDNRKALVQALSAALDRMIGYRGQKSS